MMQTAVGITGGRRLILASASPRRLALLRQIGLSPEVEPACGEEKPAGASPEEIVKGLAFTKAAGVAARHAGEPALVLGADTIVVLDGRVLGKPADEADAAAMLASLSGRAHEVWTGVAFIDCGADSKDIGSGHCSRVFADRTHVEVYTLTPEEIRAYIASGEPMDKAGAYGIQGRFAAHIRGISGDYTTVVGLPLGRLYQELKTFTNILEKIP